MTAEHRRLPVFVYGTLRPGEANHDRFLSGRTVAEEPGRLRGAVLYEGPGWPYAVADPEAEIHGELVVPAAEHYDRLLAELDQLEDYAPGNPHNLYERVAREVRLADGRTTRAWVYLAAEPVASRLRASGTLLPGGDWRGRRDGERRPMPKAELHLHIEGTLEPDLAFALAARNGVRLPYASEDELRAAYSFADLQSFLDLYYALMAVLRTEEDFADLAHAYLERARRQGVRHAEIFFDPQAHTARGVPIGTVIDGLTRALEVAPETYGITTRLIMCFLRDFSAESALETFESARPYLERIAAVGLDSAEAGNPPSKFREVYARAREAGLRCVAHAGEEGPPSYVREALDVLGVDRIDHGVRCMEDEALVARLAADQVPLTVCPLSNVRLRVYDRLEDHPLRAMLDAGLLVTVNSDDPAYFGGYVEDNFTAVRDALGLDAQTLRLLARNSFRASFLDEAARAAYLKEVDAYGG